MTHESSIAESVQKPAQVRIAILLLYTYALISFLVNVVLTTINGKFSVGLVMYQAIIFLVSVFFVFTISKGKTWARNLLLIFFIWEILSSLYFLTNINADLRYQFIISVTRYSLGLISVVLLYFKPAKQWFGTFK